MKYIALSILLFAHSVSAQVTQPVLSSWLINTNAQTGYNSQPCNIQSVRYSDSNVYISCSCIPGYDIGPWPGNPNTPVDQNFLFKIVRNPQPNTGTPTATPLGHIGVWSNGISIFNAKDANSYKNAGVWNQNAIVVEGSSFDECLGHPAPNGEYHHHLNPACLYNQKDSMHHSPIIGYAFDGYPIYGAYGYDKTDGTGTIRRMRSSYHYRNISDRTTLPNGTVLTSSQYGPPISTQYPLGYYIEDFEYVGDLGDLDSNNGRFCVTPEYPNGIYAYFVTVDSTNTAIYPYTVGPNYYGIVLTADIGPASGHITISEPVLTYVPSSNGVTPLDTGAITLTLYPNPSSNWLIVDYSSTRDFARHIDILDERGKSVYSENITGSTMLIPVTNFANGNYFVNVETSSGKTKVVRMVKG